MSQEEKTLYVAGNKEKATRVSTQTCILSGVEDEISGFISTEEVFIGRKAPRLGVCMFAE